MLEEKFINELGQGTRKAYSQLIDDYDKDIEVKTIDGEKESLTSYILRMAPGGVE